MVYICDVCALYAIFWCHIVFPDSKHPADKDDMKADGRTTVMYDRDDSVCL